MVTCRLWYASDSQLSSLKKSDSLFGLEYLSNYNSN